MPNKTFLMGIDQGTTGSTVLIVEATNSKNTKIVGKATITFPQYYPQPGWVEHDLEEIWNSVRAAAQQAMSQAEKIAQFKPSQLAGLGITNQRETLCVYERGTGKPLRKAIVWQCKRSASICDRLRPKNQQSVQQKTGLMIDPYFTASKIAWVMENDAPVATLLKSGKAVVGNIDSYLLSRLTGGKVHATEASNASRTMLYDIEKGEFDQGLLDLFAIPSRDILPEVCDSATLFGKTVGLNFLPDGIPITGILGDQQAALAGQTCFNPGEAKCTYGTGAFLMLNTGTHRLHSKANLMTTVAWSIKGQRTFAFEGGSYVAGAAVQFIRDQLGLIATSAECEVLADKAYVSPQLYFVPALAGLGAPYWNADARGALLGMTRGTTKAQIMRAVLEGVAFQVVDLLTAMKMDMPDPLKVLRVDGGASANNLLMQLQADLGAISVDRPQNLETTGFGATLFAGLGAGVFNSLGELSSLRTSDRLFHADNSAKAAGERTQRLEGWQRAVQAIQVFTGRS